MAAEMSFAFKAEDSSDGEIQETPRCLLTTSHHVSLSTSPSGTEFGVDTTGAVSTVDDFIDDPLDAFSLEGRSTATIKRVRKPAPVVRRGAGSQAVKTRSPPRAAPGPFVGELDRKGWVANLAANFVGWRDFLRMRTEAKRAALLAKARSTCAWGRKKAR